MNALGVLSRAPVVSFQRLGDHQFVIPDHIFVQIHIELLELRAEQGPLRATEMGARKTRCHRRIQTAE